LNADGPAGAGRVAEREVLIERRRVVRRGRTLIERAAERGWVGIHSLIAASALASALASAFVSATFAVLRSGRFVAALPAPPFSVGPFAARPFITGLSPDAAIAYGLAPLAVRAAAHEKNACQQNR
jgi:hypothetical protein